MAAVLYNTIGTLCCEMNNLTLGRACIEKANKIILASRREKDRQYLYIMSSNLGIINLIDFQDEKGIEEIENAVVYYSNIIPKYIKNLAELHEILS